MRRRVSILVLLGAAMILTSGLWMMAKRPAPISFPMPNPNGYDDLVKAATVLVGDLSDYHTLNAEGLQSLLATNAEALRLVRLGLSRTCSVPTDVVITNFGSVMGDLADQKRLAFLLYAEGRLAELQERSGDATRGYLDMVRLGNEVSRGGLIINRQSGIACEALGVSKLARLAPSLDCERQRAIAAELLTLDRSAVEWKEIMRIESLGAGYHARGHPSGLVVYVQTLESERGTEASTDGGGFAPAGDGIGVALLPKQPSEFPGKPGATRSRLPAIRPSRSIHGTAFDLPRARDKLAAL